MARQIRQPMNLIREAEKGTMAENEKMNNEKNGSMQRYLTDCSLTRMEGEGNERKFVLSFSSEEPYDRWWGTEILSHSEGALDLTRLNSIGVVLYNHNRDKVIGKILRAWVEDGRGKAEIEFDSDADSEVIYQKVSGGTLKGVSVGYVILLHDGPRMRYQSSVYRRIRQLVLADRRSRAKGQRE